MDWVQHVLIRIVLHLIFLQRQTDEGIFFDNGKLAPLLQANEPSKWKCVKVSHEGNKLSMLSVSQFQRCPLCLHTQHLEQSGSHFSEKTTLVFLGFSLLSCCGSGSVSFFHHKLVKQVTPLLIGWIPSSLDSNWPAERWGSLSLSALATLQCKVVWHDDLSGKECWQQERVTRCGLKSDNQKHGLSDRMKWGNKKK